MVCIERNSVLEPLAPLVKAGYRALAARALNGINSWNSSISPEHRKNIDEMLSAIILRGEKSAPVIYIPTIGGKDRPRVLSQSGSLLEDSVSSVTGELFVLAETGDVSGINPVRFNRMFFALDYTAFFGMRMPNAEYAVRTACNLAAGYYLANGGQDFANQLKVVAKLGGIRVLPQTPGVDPTDDGRLAVLTFNASDGASAVLNMVIGLRLLYLAANKVLKKPDDYVFGLGKRITADFASSIPESYLGNDFALQAIGELLDSVSLHSGVENIILGFPGEMPSGLKEALLLGKVLDTVKTGKVALLDNDKPYSDAIGIAEFMANYQPQPPSSLQQTI
jgi:hypothetical protein